MDTPVSSGKSYHGRGKCTSMLEGHVKMWRSRSSRAKQSTSSSWWASPTQKLDISVKWLISQIKSRYVLLATLRLQGKTAFTSWVYAAGFKLA